MSNKSENPDAFPKFSTIRSRYGDVPLESTVNECAGMTLRDYFAASALPGVLAALPYSKGVDGEPIKNVNGVAELAYKQADAMLAERNKP